MLLHMLSISWFFGTAQSHWSSEADNSSGRQAERLWIRHASRARSEARLRWQGGAVAKWCQPGFSYRKCPIDSWFTYENSDFP